MNAEFEQQNWRRAAQQRLLSEPFVSSDFIGSGPDAPGGLLDLQKIGSGYGSSLSFLETDFFF